MDQFNLFLIGAVIGGIIGSCFSINAIKGKSNKAEEKVRAYEQYYKCTETLLDSLDGTHDLDLMDTDLETDYGVDYLEAKSKVDELIAKQHEYIGIWAIVVGIILIVLCLKAENHGKV